MDFAQHLADLRQQSPEQWVKRANLVLPPLVMGVLVLAIAYELAGLTWTVLSGPALEGPPPVVATGTVDSTARPQTSSYAALEGWKPFGEPPDPSVARVVEAVVDAPDTTLNLQLWGVHGATNAASGAAEPEVGAAFISSGRSEQKVYYVGDTIEGGSGATLHSVYFDRVLLDRGGRLETLRLPQELAAAAPPPVQRPDIRQPTAVSPPPTAASIREVISDNAARFTEIVRIVPDMRGGQMSGFRLTPGRDREAFAALGLQPGDVLTEVNGMILNDPQTAGQVFSALGEATMANVTVLRDGNPQVLTIDMSQIESLTENLQ